MNSLTTLTIRNEYRSPQNDVVQELFIPALSCAKIYKRSVGFFSSTSLVEITKGITELIKNKGQIQIVASPKLSDEDIDAIRAGYEKRSEIIERRLLGEIEVEETDYFRNARLNLLANLIANGFLSLKIAFIDSGNEVGIYHEKLGVFEDFDGQKIAFDGSMNESRTAMRYNYESVNVYCDWKSEDKERAQAKISAFENIWNNTEQKLTVVDFPSVTSKILEKYKRQNIDFSAPNWDKDFTDSAPSNVHESNPDYRADEEKSVSYDMLREYQKCAIDTWMAKGCCGIYDMATGTGKTLTALFSLDSLRKRDNGNLSVVILCPYIHLVTQWLEDIEKFNIKPIVAFGSSPQRDWKEKLKRAVDKRNFCDNERGFFCLVSTIATFKSDFVQGVLAKNRKPILLIADEAHNLGAQDAIKYLERMNFVYKLALSATIDRHMDEFGTKFLHSYFGEKCIEYGLKEAIDAGYLVPYDYIPVVVSLDSKERESYAELTKQMAGEIRISPKTHEKCLSEYGKKLAIARSRLIAGAKNKLTELMKRIEPYKNENKILIYCGATKYSEDIQGFDSDNQADVRQIEAITMNLYEKFDMRIAKFTADESSEERSSIITRFEEKILQAIVAIRCLDEGVNIPMIETAFILASSTNPKEYIQRRGRVLRKYKDKVKATIYDFITLPYDLIVASAKDPSENEMYSTLIRNEVTRMTEFGSLALNKSKTLSLIDEIKTKFQTTKQLNAEDSLYEF